MAVQSAHLADQINAQSAAHITAFYLMMRWFEEMHATLSQSAEPTDCCELAVLFERIGHTPLHVLLSRVTIC